MSRFKEFIDLNIRLGKVLECREMENSDSLLELIVDVGEEKPRTIVSGIKEWYKPEELIGEFVLLALNLPLGHLKSEGFLLAVDADNSAVLLKPDPKYLDKIKPGMRLS